MIDHYDWSGGREAMMRFGPDSGPVVIMLLPLFEEHNRTRTFAVTICRALADLGVASVLPDLPGQGESLAPTDQATLEIWRDGVTGVVQAELVRRRVYLASFRAGAVLDGNEAAAGVWRLSPITGQTALADLQRAETVSGKRDWDALGPEDAPVQLAGNAIGWPLYTALRADAVLIEPQAPHRTVRLESDPATADIKFPGAPLWRRAEPGNDPTLARALASDIADWVRSCES
ncbi:MAG: hypothetical protein BVN33_09285 [Proteobacteria bacterium ST_bin13]|nr:MAG: hypothetical protein BVN33_09285 [Proteobacteria bacterium ST_bin13]